MDHKHERVFARIAAFALFLGSASFLFVSAGCNSREGNDVTQATAESDTTQVDSVATGRTLLISPRSGPPGTRVHLVGSGYEPGTMIQIGIGPMNSEFEIIDSARTSAGGELDTTVVINALPPDSSGYVFVVTKDQVSWKVISDPFILTADAMSNEQGSVTVRGTLTDEGVECQAMRGEDGTLYTLTGDLAGFKTGDHVRVAGTVAEVSICQQGTTIAVTRIERISASGK